MTFQSRKTAFSSTYLPILLSLLLATFLSLAVFAPRAWSQEPAGEAQQQEQDTGEAASGEPAEGEGESAAELQILLDALRNEESRNRLIEELEAAVGDAATPAEETIAAVDNALLGNEAMSIGRRIAETTRYFAESAAQSVGNFWTQLSAAPATFAELDGEEIALLWDAFRELAILIVATYAIFLGLRQIAKRMFRSMGARSRESGIIQRAVLLVVSALLDAFVVVAAWAAGYAVALIFFGDVGTMALRQTLYLNAFMIVELCKVVLRIVLSPSTSALRPLPISDAAANWMNRGFTWIISILGYGQLLLQPIFNQSLSQASGQAASALFALIALAIAVGMTLRARAPMAEWLLRTPDGAPRSRQARFLAHRWHWPVLLYLAFLFVIVIGSPTDVLLAVLAGSAKVAVALIIGLAISGWLTRASVKGIRLPEKINQRLPLLEHRLNAFVPKLLTVLRVAIFVVVLMIVLDTVNFLDLQSWLRSQFGLRATRAIISVFLIVVVAFGAWLALNSWVDYRLNPDFGRPASTREQTLLSLLRNAATIAILVIALMFALSELGLNIAPLLASAGVLGLAIGFGAQKLVQDIITGVFIQLENAINVGDTITVGGTTGTVERLTIRSVSLRDVEGAYHIIPFSSVDMVTNFMRDFAYHVGDIGIGYREDVEEARAAIGDAFEMLRKDPELAPSILGDMEWFGVQSLADSAVIVRVRIKTLPGKQWGIGRALNGHVKRVFDERGIEMPYPVQTLYFGEDKRGRAPAAHITLEQKATPTPAPAAAAAGGTGGGRDNHDGIPHADDEQTSGEGEAR